MRTESATWSVRHPRLRQWLWFVAIWAGSVAALGAATWLLKRVLSLWL
ncbi:DUF2474 family protein [Panacagrimonas sp.]